MTKQQAYNQAIKENGSSVDKRTDDIILRAMEIYTQAFARFIQKKGFLPLGFQNMWYKNFATPNYESKTTNGAIRSF